MEKKFKYDAFISYRHTDLDKFVAENLHRELESFRLPRSVAKKRPGQKNKIERVFRDKEELPITSNLNDPIMEALHSSEYLIVICSPRLRESLWCKKEIETFVALRGREHVMAVIIEGEPQQSFPDELLFRVEKHPRADGTIEEVKIPVEPLAADVRGKDKKEVKKLIKTETMRLCAGMFHLNYDDIRQRHREQKMRRILTASLIAGALFFAFGVYSSITALRINSQKQQIEAQEEEIRLQNKELALRQALSMAELSEQYLNNGDRNSAVVTATEALTESDGIELPYTPEAHYALNESLRAYDIGVSAKAEYQVEMSGRIESVKQSPDSDTLAIYDNTGAITLFDIAQKEIIRIINPNIYDTLGDYGFTFVDDTRFAYLNKDDVLCIMDLSTKEMIKEIPLDQGTKITAGAGGNYLAVEQWDSNFMIIDGNTYETLGTTPKLDVGFYVDGPYISADGILVCGYSRPTDDVSERELYDLYFIDLKTMKVLSSFDLGYKKVQDVEFRDGVAYVVLVEYGEMYESADACVMAIDARSGSVIWKNEQEDCWVDEIAVPICEDATDLLLTTSESAFLLDLATGEVTMDCTIGDEVIDINLYADANDFTLFTKSGEFLYVRTDLKKVMDLSYKFECKTSNHSYINNCGYGIAVVPYNDNKITVYTYETGPNIKEIEQTVELPEAEIMIGGEAQKIAQSYQLEDSNYVLEAYYSPDGNYCFISYWDRRLVICDTQKKAIINTIEDAYSTELCIGTDSEGNTYLSGYYGVYVLNQDMKPVMWIEHAKDVDIENGKVYLNWLNSNYEAPLYSLEDLLEIAEVYQG